MQCTNTYLVTVGHVLGNSDRSVIITFRCYVLGNSDRSVLIITFRCYAEIANHTRLKYYYDQGNVKGMKANRPHRMGRYMWHYERQKNIY